MFSKSLATGRTSEIVVQVSEYKGKVGVDVRKHYHGEPTKKGAFLEVSNGQAEFVVKALPVVLQDGSEQILEGDGINVVVRRYDYKGMEGYSIRKENRGGSWGKGIWVKAEQAPWIVEAMQEALATG